MTHLIALCVLGLSAVIGTYAVAKLGDDSLRLERRDVFRWVSVCSMALLVTSTVVATHPAFS